MILHFSGTGNSLQVALGLSSALGDKIRSITEASIRDLKPEENRIIFVFPVYSWGVPPIVLDFVSGLDRTLVQSLNDSGCKIMAVLTYGDETGMAPEMFEKALNRNGLNLHGVWGVTMPNNYVLLPGFDTDSKDIEERKLSEAKARIGDIAAAVERGEVARDFVRGPWPRLKTRLVYPLFRRWGMNVSKWKWTDRCIKCGRCAAVCPVHNIEMKDGHPCWHENCTSCLACYHICPRHAVGYANVTQNKGQYFNPNVQISNKY